jgi:hypothetical protein
MPKIERRVTPEVKANWQAFCKSRGFSESEMLAMMIERVTSGEVDLEPKGLAEVKTNQINIKLPAAKIDEITQRAKIINTCLHFIQMLIILMCI